MADTSLVYNILARDRATPVIGRSAAAVRAASLASAAGTAAMGVAMASAASWAVALASAIGSTVGAAAAAPGAFFAAAAAVTTWKIATFGLSDAWKATGKVVAGGGGSAASTAKRVASATREVADATRAVADAERAQVKTREAINAAYAEATERLQDLTRSVAGAQLDEEAAVLAVAEAQKALNVARRGGDLSEVKRADLAYRQSQQTLEEVRDRLGDLTEEEQRAQAAGVDGAEEVLSAKERDEQATRQLEDATRRLADAQDALTESAAPTGGAIDAAAEAMAALSPNARQLITTLRALGPAWTAALRHPVQDAALKGISADVIALSGVYLPVLSRRLVSVADGFNGMVRRSAALAQTKGFVADVDSILGDTATTVDRLGRAVTPLVNGLVMMGQVGAGFLPGLADSALHLAENFERWVAAARQSGQLQQWIGGAIGVLHQLWDIAVNVGASVLAIFRAGNADGSGQQLLSLLVQGSAQMRAWLESAQGQARVAQIFEMLRQVLTLVTAILPALTSNTGALDSAMSSASATITVAGTVMKFLADHIGLVAQLLPILIPLYLAEKAGIGASNVIKLVQLVLMARHTGALMANNAAMRANTAAMAANTGASATNTVATTAGDVAQRRSVVSMVASRAAMIASATAARIAAAGQWLLNAALYANPIGLIVLALIAIGVGLYLLWTRSETFRKIVTAAFDAVWGAIKAGWDWVSTNWPLLLAILTGPIGLAVLYITKHWDDIKAGAVAAKDWIVQKFNDLVGFVTGLPGRIAGAASSMWDGIRNSFRNVINWIVGKWNNLSFTIGGGSFMGISIPSVSFYTPDLPYLAAGGRISTAGAAVVGEAGPEIVSLPRGAQVTPLDRTGGGRLVIDVRGAEDEFTRLIRKLVRTGNLLQEA